MSNQPRVFPRILIVDDSSSVRRTLTFWLQDAPCEIVEAANSDEAIQVVKVQRIDLILTDLFMPGKDGIALAQELRTMPGLTAVPILLMTGSDTSDLRKRASNAGIQDILTKPGFVENLWPTLAGYLSMGRPESRPAPNCEFV